MAAKLRMTREILCECTKVVAATKKLVVAITALLLATATLWTVAYHVVHLVAR